ncbi:MAG: DUF4296 domain-containing protein [Bacteroidales bacterium]|nr:DUF4296 domain-containing protein [Bacteroidales bacterium]
MMRNIILDISKAERMTMEQDLNREEKKAKTEAYKKSILKHYNVTQQDYQQDIQIYLENPPLMKKLYE